MVLATDTLKHTQPYQLLVSTMVQLSSESFYFNYNKCDEVVLDSNSMQGLYTIESGY